MCSLTCVVLVLGVIVCCLLLVGACGLLVCVVSWVFFCRRCRLFGVCRFCVWFVAVLRALSVALLLFLFGVCRCLRFDIRCVVFAACSSLCGVCWLSLYIVECCRWCVVRRCLTLAVVRCLVSAACCLLYDVCRCVLLIVRVACCLLFVVCCVLMVFVVCWLLFVG